MPVWPRSSGRHHTRRHIVPSEDRDPPLHECPKERCGNRVPREMFACRVHWFELTSDLRWSITMAWQLYRTEVKAGRLDGARTARAHLEEVATLAQHEWRSR